MTNHRNIAFIRTIAILLVFTFIIPVGASAATVQPRASLYLDNYGAYVYLPGTGEVRVYFNAEGTRTMDELGVLRIAVYESTDGINYTWVETFNHYTTAGMLGYDKYYHSGYVSYNGVAGRYYKAYVCVWGGKDGAGDTRYFWTSPKH